MNSLYTTQLSTISIYFNLMKLDLAYEFRSAKEFLFHFHVENSTNYMYSRILNSTLLQYFMYLFSIALQTLQTSTTNRIYANPYLNEII